MDGELEIADEGGEEMSWWGAAHAHLEEFAEEGGKASEESNVRLGGNLVCGSIYPRSDPSPDLESLQALELSCLSSPI